MATRLSDPPPAPGVPAAPATDTPRDAVTVAEVQRVLLPGSLIAGGAGGLHRRVTWATSLRSRPPAFEPRGGGEFVLASRETLDSLRQVDQSLTLSRVLDGLAQARAAALALPRPVPPEAAAAADALGLPLIEVPDGVSALEAERSIIALVLDRNNELQRRASEFYRQLAHLSVESQGLDAILQQAATITGGTVAFEDDRFRLRSVASPPSLSAPPLDSAGLSSVEERSRLAELARAHPLSTTTPTAALLPAARWATARYAAPVVTRDRLRGWVSLCADASRLTEFDQLAASRLAAICAIELAKEDAVLAAEQRVQGDLVDELLRPYGDADVAARRAAQAGLAVDGIFAVVVFGLDAGGAGAAGAGAAVTDAIARHLRRAACAGIARPDVTDVLVICQVAAGKRGNGHHASEPGSEDAEARARRLAEELFSAAREAGGVLGAGASRAHVSLAALPQAAREAREALRIGRRVYGAGRLVAFADLGLYRVLHALRDTPELGAFFEQTLGHLVEYDRRTGQNLIDTLEAFFACNGNLSQTAKRTGFHRNSLQYRIQRIQEIAGVELEDPETRLSLQVALKARRLLA